jgi:hypothetical protein
MDTRLIISWLEHYFEMSQVDAQNALKIYQHFCKQTERVVNYLGIAKKLQSVLNVQIPNLRHVSASGSLRGTALSVCTGARITCQDARRISQGSQFRR